MQEKEYGIKVNKIRLSAAEAIVKIKNWCAYQERYHQEVMDKLLSYGLSPKECAEITALLVEENYLNEERFAIAFAGGKFRVKQWGKNKIKAELQFRKISEYSTKRALSLISEDDYKNSLEQLIIKKNNQIKEPDKRKRFHKLLKYALAKGYEKNLSEELINKVIS